MLALGMAFIEQPRLLMIDELSLGLAPDDRRAAAAARARHRRAGHHDHPRRAVGEPRAHDRGDRVLHGEGRDPLPRPDRRAARTARRAALGVPRRRGDTRWTTAIRRAEPVDRPAPRRARRARRARQRRTTRSTPRAIRLGARRRVEALRRPRRAHATCRSTRARRRDRRLHRARTARARPRCSTSISGFTPPTRARSSLGEGDDARRHHAAVAGAARPPRARPLVPGRPAVPVAHRRRDDRARVRAPPRGARPDRRRAAPAVRRRRRSRHRRERSRSSSSCSASPTSATSSVRELSTGSRRIVDLACVLAHDPSVLLLDEPSSGIAQREAEALGPLLLRIREQTGRDAARDRARRTVAALDRRPARSRSISARSSPSANPTMSCSDPDRRAVVSRHHRSRDRTKRHRAGQTDAITGTRGNTMATPQTPQLRSARRSRVTRRSSRSSWSSRSSRCVIAVVSGGDDDKKTRRRPRPRTTGEQTFANVPDLLQRGEGRGHARQVHVAGHCDTTTGRVAIPILNPPPCVPEANGDNGGATVARRDRRHDQDRLLHRQARPDLRRAR